ncbi:hypothetical protein [Haladaptatus salinisoli]|uniref:hypothetical protein n=1 Tax=Haladaptatus salinisoli TaxID=2884876 RepID=UPI001D0AF34F|nr:hypothetical protein [Haladaptatus salinisoli]
MSLPRRLEQVGIVVGSVLMVSLPVSVLTALLIADPTVWQLALLWCVPGALVGVLIATNRVPVAYDQVWAFGIVSWAVTLLLWTNLDVSMTAVLEGNADLSASLGAWVVGLLIGLLAAYRRRPEKTASNAS